MSKLARGDGISYMLTAYKDSWAINQGFESRCMETLKLCQDKQHPPLTPEGGFSTCATCLSLLAYANYT